SQFRPNAASQSARGALARKSSIAPASNNRHKRRGQTRRHPNFFQIKLGVGGLRTQTAKIGCELLEHLGSADRQGLRSELARAVAFDKGDKDAWRPTGR